MKCSKNAMIIFLLMAIFLCFEMALQVSPGVMTSSLSADMHLNAFDLGLMSGMYFVTYSAMQIPSGLMYDRLNIVKVVSSAILICGIGAGLFGLSESMLSASAARMFMGFGSAFAFLSVLTVAARYFEPKYFATLAGIAQLLAALGAMGGELPIAWLNSRLGWRHSFTLFMCSAFVLIVLILLAFRNIPVECRIPKQSEKIRSSLKEILKSSQTWFVGLYALLNWAPMTAFASLWGVPFLMLKYGMSLDMAASLCSLLWLGVGLSSPLMGMLSDAIQSRKAVLVGTAFSGALSLVALIYLPHLSTFMLGVLLFIAGLGSSGQIVSFAVIKDRSAVHRTSAAIGFNNMAEVASGLIMQPLIGKLLLVTGAGMKSLYAFLASLWVLPLCQVICVLLALLLIRETYIKTRR